MAEYMNVHLPKLLEEEADFYIKAGFYSSRAELIREAVRYYLQHVLKVNVDIAVGLYSKGEISLGKSAELAGVSYEDMRQILKARGIGIKIGPESVEEGRKEIEELKKRVK